MTFDEFTQLPEQSRASIEQSILELDQAVREQYFKNYPRLNSSDIEKLTELLTADSDPDGDYRINNE